MNLPYELRKFDAPKTLSIHDLAKVSTLARTEAETVENPLWQQALSELAASADQVMRLHIGASETED